MSKVFVGFASMVIVAFIFFSVPFIIGMLVSKILGY